MARFTEASEVRCLQTQAQLSPLDQYFQTLASLLSLTPILRRNQIIGAVRLAVTEMEENASLPAPYTLEQLYAYLGDPQQVVAIADADMTVIKAGNGAQVIQAAEAAENSPVPWERRPSGFALRMLAYCVNMGTWWDGERPCPLRP